MFESNKLLTEMLVFLLFKNRKREWLFMIIETKQLIISEELKRKIKFICRFANANYTLTNGIIKSV